MNELRVTLIQSPLFWEDKNRNMVMFEDKIQSIEDDTDLILLPEMFSTGFTMKAETLYEEMNGKCVHRMLDWAKKKSAFIAGTLIIKENNLFYNRLIIASPDGTIQHYDKRHLFGLGAEDKTYTAGKERLLIEIKDWKICPMICYDLRFPVWSRNQPETYDLLIYLANWPERRIHHWKTLLPARAVENQSYVIGLNRIGEDGNGMNHTGQSIGIDPNGFTLASLDNREEIKTIVLSKEELIKFRRQLPFLRDADQVIIK